MRRSLEQWLTADARLRVASWSAAMLLLILLGGLWVIQPGYQALEQQRISLAASLQAIKAQQQQKRALGTQLHAAQRNLPALASERFSAMAMGKLPGVTLMKWQPEGEVAELELRSQWLPVPELFDALSRTDARLKRFSVAAGEGALTVTLWLEVAHEK
ncbi:hypothetical protein [Atlantibacter sp.]|uniref:HofO family protein n=1 Tax=Atlantibacter sp. TaxID=1903473 RepID=UPI0028ABC275|nr:hypothetical protein [Atlantibacter sp.]